MKLSYKPLSNPILILSDSPSLLSGLSRIGRDLASLLCTLPQFRVAYLGRGGVARRKFPWFQIDFPESEQWGERYIADVWRDFSGGEPGVIFSNWDLSRLLWLAQPQGTGLESFAGDGRNFSKWIYSPIDSTGPNGVSLNVGNAGALHGFDRVCAASEFGREVMQVSGRGDADWLPHGLFMNVFYPLYGVGGWRRNGFVGWHNDDVVVGCNMTNQARKDYPAAFECAAALKAHYGNRFKFWLHTDSMIRYWNIYALAADYGVNDCLEVTLELTDQQLALRYSACDCTVLPSAGEGFGYPAAESLACGTACIVTDYAAAPALVEESCRVTPLTYRVDTLHNCRRAVLHGYAFAMRAIEQIEKKRQDWEFESERLRSTVEYLDWEKLKHVWIKWFLEGLK